MTAVAAAAGGINITGAVGDDVAVAFTATTLDWSTVTVTTGITLNGAAVATDFAHTLSTTTAANDTLTLSLTDTETSALGQGSFRYFVQTTPDPVVTVVQPPRRRGCVRARTVLDQYLQACEAMGLPSDTSVPEFVSHVRAAGATALLIALRARDERNT